MSRFSKHSLRAVLLATVLVVTVNAGSPSSEMSITNAWASPTPPGITVGAAFMTFVASTHDRLLSASSPVAERVELHSMDMHDGVMHMRPLDGVDLPAGKPVELKPSGMHFMLVGLKQPLQLNSRFPLQLRFEKSGERNVKVQVRAQP